ncbi:MAG: substrate-binding domain-containing protein [Armatimonadetes bacterium]|nr:substrate-binding domain-containing protein [Armatimonadota bacterium]
MRYGLIAATIGLGLVLGCSKPPEAPAGGAPIGMSQCNRGEPWRVQMDTDVKDAAANHADQLEVTFQDAQNDVKTQQSQVRDFVAQRYDLIIISPKEARPLAAPVSEAMKAGIPVIVLDRDIDGGDYTCFIGADNVKIGRELGKHMVQVLGGKGNVVELKGLQTSTPGHDRHNGFMEGIKGSGLKIVYDSDCRWLEDKAKADMQSVLTRFPDIDAVYGHNDPSAHGAYMAAKQEGKGREKTIKFLGIDALPHEGVRYVEEGILTATFQYPTGGQEAIDMALKIFAGEKVEKKMVLGTRLFTAENVAKGGEAVE